MSLSEVYPGSPRMERKRARLPHSERLIWPTVIFTSHGVAANAPIATSVMAATCRIDGLILSATKSPRPRPRAVRVHAAIMVVLTADHVIANGAAFQETLTLAADAAEETSELVTIGIKPTWACPGFGYIEHGKPVRLHKRPDSDAIHRVVRFREKPNPDLAESFLRRGNFRWNAGMFVWSVPTVLREFNRHAPELADFISQLRAVGNFDKALCDRFSKLPRISFDYAIMEKADRVLVVEAGFDWDDIGSWRAVANYFEKDKRGN